jgi:hypothetical protein
MESALVDGNGVGSNETIGGTVVIVIKSAVVDDVNCVEVDVVSDGVVTGEAPPQPMVAITVDIISSNMTVNPILRFIFEPFYCHLKLCYFVTVKCRMTMLPHSSPPTTV